MSVFGTQVTAALDGMRGLTQRRQALGSRARKRRVSAALCGPVVRAGPAAYCPRVTAREYNNTY